LSRVHHRARRLPVAVELLQLPQVVLHERERGHLPRDTGRAAAAGRRRVERRRHGVPSRLPRRLERDGVRRELRRKVEEAPDDGVQVPLQGDRGREARGAVSRHRRGGHSSRAQEGRERREELLRARDRDVVSLRAERAALREEQSRRRDENRPRVYDRADDKRGRLEGCDVAGRVDGGDEGREQERAVRAHDGRDGRRRGRADGEEREESAGVSVDGSGSSEHGAVAATTTRTLCFFYQVVEVASHR